MSQRDPTGRLRNSVPLILPSLLLCDFGNLEREVGQLEDAGIQALHLDVMDGMFVPNLTYGMPIVETLRRVTELPLDVHLMIEQPERYVREFIDAGADVVTIHVEATDQPNVVLEQIKELGAAAGIALNPDTPLSLIEPHLNRCDLVLVMSVNAGFGGQSFNPVALEKLREVRRMNEHVLLEVDGGINEETIEACSEAGADLFVVGSAIFRQPEYDSVVSRLSDLAARWSQRSTTE